MIKCFLQCSMKSEIIFFMSPVWFYYLDPTRPCEDSNSNSGGQFAAKNFNENEIPKHNIVHQFQLIIINRL